MLNRTIKKYNEQDKKIIIEQLKKSQEENDMFLELIETIKMLNPKLADKHKEKDRMIVNLIKESQQENNRLLQLIEVL